MVGLNLHVYRDHAVLSLDSSWDSLHKRGYRPIQTNAPLNEALAAGLLLQSAMGPATPLVDPLCGSGTFCIEAAWMALRRPPGLTRKWFGFQGWLGLRPAAVERDPRRGPPQVFVTELPGADPRLGRPPRRGGVREDATPAPPASATCSTSTVSSVGATAAATGRATGTLICNPPYGERIGDEKELVPLYRKLGETVAAHWPGWRLLVFTGNDWLARKIPLKSRRSTPFFNGRIPCRLWQFEVP